MSNLDVLQDRISTIVENITTTHDERDEAANAVAQAQIREENSRLAFADAWLEGQTILSDDVLTEITGYEPPAKKDITEAKKRARTTDDQ